MESLTASTTNDCLHAVNEVIASFLLSLKNFGLYAENHEVCQKCIRNTFKCIEGFLGSAATLRLDIEKDRILFQNETVFQASGQANHIAFFLFRDGIKWIEFNKGLTIEELSGFLKILNNYKMIQEDPEGDLATALWEANFPNLRYGAADIYWDSEPALDLQLPISGATTRFSEDASGQIEAGTLITAFQNPESGMYKLTPEEIARLQEMILEEQKRDSAQDLLELASILMKDEGNKDLLGALVEFIKTEVDGAISRADIESAHKTLKTVHSIRSAAKAENPWAVPYFNKLIISVSGPRYLISFSNVLRTIDEADKVRVKLIWQFFLMLHSNALEALAPMLSQIRSLSVQKQFMKILEIMASRDLELLERLLASQGEDVVQRLVYITGRIPGRKPVRILLKMTENASARVRKQAVKSLLTRNPLSLKLIFPLIEDSSPDVRQAIFDHLQQQKNEVGEKLLLRHLQKRQFAINSPQHLLACYRSLGKCGSSESIPFLKQLLFKRSWLHVFKGSIHRQGAVAALLELQTQETKTILAKASRSFFPTVRTAYKRGSEAIHC